MNLIPPTNLLPTIELPAFPYQIEQNEKGWSIFDIIRRRQVPLTREEWVRQHLIHHLIQLGYPKGLMKLEAKCPYNKRTKRSDILIYDRKGKPLLLVECKAPEIDIDEQVLHQASNYYAIHQAPHLLLSNGRQHQWWHIQQGRSPHIIDRWLSFTECMQIHKSY